jgi:hypothetical protein
MMDVILMNAVVWGLLLATIVCMSGGGGDGHA